MKPARPPLPPRTPEQQRRLQVLLLTIAARTEPPTPSTAPTRP